MEDGLAATLSRILREKYSHITPGARNKIVQEMETMEFDSERDLSTALAIVVAKEQVDQKLLIALDNAAAIACAKLRELPYSTARASSGSVIIAEAILTSAIFSELRRCI